MSVWNVFTLAAFGNVIGHKIWLHRYLRTSGKTSRALLVDFDNPTNAADNVWGLSTPLALEYLISPGDSGGGMFLDIDGMQLLAGVHSFLGSFDGITDADYGDIAGITRLSEFNKWIDDVITGGDGGSNGGGTDKPNNGRGGGRPSFAMTATIIPEPASLALFGLGAVMLVRRRR